MRLAITAGFNRSPAAIALCELLQRSGHTIGCVIVVTPFSVKRLRALIAQRGLGAFKSAVRKLLRGRSNGAVADPLQQLLASEGIVAKSLRDWCRQQAVPCSEVRDINGEPTIALLRASAIDAVVYAGGGILRKAFIDAAQRAVINPHCGPLPEIRGMNAIEWAVLLEQEPAITVHYIDEGIDTGAIIQRTGLPLHAGENVDSLRARAVVAGIRALVQQLAAAASVAALPRRDPGAAPGRQCYTLAPVLKEILQHRLDRL